MKNTPPKPTYFRVRVSTVLLFLALPTYPFAVNWIRDLNIPDQPPLLHKALSWFFFALSPELIAIAFIVAFITAFILGYQRKWWGIPQCLGEMGVCLLCILVIPGF